MTNFLLAIGLIAAPAYGYWLMARLDRFISQENGAKAAPAGHWDAMQRAWTQAKKRLAALLPTPRASGADPAESHTHFAI